MPKGVTPNWNNLLNKPSVVNTVNGLSGAVTAANVSAAATAGYGYTPVSPLANNMPALPSGNVVGSVVVGTANAGSAIAGAYYGTLGGNISAVGVYSTGFAATGTWKCLGVGYTDATGYVAALFQRTA